jgi:hypothetical protein
VGLGRGDWVNERPGGDDLGLVAQPAYDAVRRENADA